MPQFDIDQHVKVLGCTREHAENIATKKRERLAQTSPKELASAKKEIAKRRAALAEAEAGLEQRRAVIADVESRLLALGRHREKMNAFRREFSAPDAASVFASWDDEFQSPSLQTGSRYGLLLSNFAAAVAIAPHVESKVSELAAMEKQMVDELLEISRTEVVGLANVLNLMTAKRAPRNGRLPDPEGHRILSSGVLSDLTKN